MPILVLREAGLPVNRLIGGYRLYRNVTLTAFPNVSAALFVRNCVKHFALYGADPCDSDIEVLAVMTTLPCFRFPVASNYVRCHSPAAKAAALVPALENVPGTLEYCVVISIPTILCGQTPGVISMDVSFCKLLRSVILL